MGIVYCFKEAACNKNYDSVRKRADRTKGRVVVIANDACNHDYVHVAVEIGRKKTKRLNIAFTAKDCRNLDFKVGQYIEFTRTGNTTIIPRLLNQTQPSEWAVKPEIMAGVLSHEMRMNLVIYDRRDTDTRKNALNHI